MKKLPKIYQNEINKKICNNKKTCYLKNESIDEFKPLESETINQVINEVFSGLGYSYNIPLTIKTKNQTYKTSLIAKSKNNLITLDNNIIPIKDIISIEKN